MTREEFLDKNYERLKLMDVETYNKAVKDLKKMDNARWIEEYAPVFMEAGVNTDDMAALKKTVEPLPKRLREAFGDLKFAPSEKWKNRVYKQEFSDVDKDEFEKGLAKMKEYFDKEEAQKRAEADKEKRKREVKNWGWRDFLTSDYEKQRYVEEPQAALFGEQAPSLGDAPETRWGSAADLGLGVAGAAGDVVPGWGSVLLGPGARIARDVGHKVTDSPYQKEWGDIVKGGIADVMVSGGTIALPNFRKQMRMYNNMMTMPKNVSATMAIETEANNILEGTRKLGKLRDQPLEFRKTLAGLPESQLTKDLAPLMNSETIDWGKVHEVMKKNANVAYALKDAEGRATYRLGNNQLGVLNEANAKADPVTNLIIPGRSFTPLQKAVLETAEPTAKELKSATRKMLLDKGIAKFSNPAANLVVTVPGGRGKGKVNKVETPEEREEIEVIKKREAPFWNKNDKPWFKPRKDNSLMYKAWKEYADEHGWEVED